MDSSDEKSGKEWFAVVQDFLYENLLPDSELESEHKGCIRTERSGSVRKVGVCVDTLQGNQARYVDGSAFQTLRWQSFEAL